MDGASGFAAAVVSGTSDFADKVVDSTQGFASAAQTIVDTLAPKKKAPILLMHGAIQGGWVWEFPRITNGAPLVRLLSSGNLEMCSPTMIVTTESLGSAPHALTPRFGAQ